MTSPEKLATATDTAKDELLQEIKNKDFLKEADIFKALGHPIRLKIVYGLLKVGGCNVKNMQECLGLHQATVSQHLIHLKTRGIISSSRKGLEMVYTVTHPWAKCIIDHLEEGRLAAPCSAETEEAGARARQTSISQE
jgi:DNA-binding transcriptional ArsR family regulator